MGYSRLASHPSKLPQKKKLIKFSAIFILLCLDHIPSNEEQATGLEKLEYDALMGGVQVCCCLFITLIVVVVVVVVVVCRILGIWKY